MLRKTVWSTPQLGLFDTSHEFSETWPRAGTMRAGVCYLRPDLERRTSESASGSLLPTPSAASFGTSQNGQRADGSTFKGAGKPSLETMAGRGLLPDATVRMDPHGERGRLNPCFVEWMQAWPIGATDLRPLATGRLAAWLSRHGVCSEDHDS